MCAAKYPQELALPKRQRQVPLFVDQEQQKKLKIRDIKENDILLARLSLDHLGFTNFTLFLFGCLSTLYVSDPPHDFVPGLKKAQ